MTTVARKQLSNVEIAREKERMGISGSMNRAKILENPEQYRMLKRRSERIFSEKFRFVGVVDGFPTYEMVSKR